jgi:FkbM family methyltransferase
MGSKPKAPVEHAYGNVAITLPADHALPAYQRQHRLYDRFLPHLVQHLDAGSVVVDVGANCGDTVAAMYANNPSLNYVCVEPDQGFFDLMVRNVEKIAANDPDASIRCVQSLIGKAVSSAVLEGSAGTKKAKLAELPGAMRSVTLDSLFVEFPACRAHQVRRGWL